MVLTSDEMLWLPFYYRTFFLPIAKRTGHAGKIMADYH